MKIPKARFAVALAVTGWMICGAVNSQAGDVKLVANPSVRIDTISVAELKLVYLEEKISLEGSHVEPVLEKDGRVHEAFLQAYLGISEDDLQTYYRTLVFTGRGSMPRTLASDAEVVAYVAHTRGAIGYVSASADVEGLKLLTVGASNSEERRLLTRVEPTYPETLRRLNIGGTVRLRVSISAKGNVEQVELLGGNPILGESATLAVQQWVYAAGRSRTISEISIVFDRR